MDELAVAQCSSFVKHHEWILAMYFIVMLECCSLFILVHLEGYLMFIADRWHICFACHFETVQPIPVIFISISTEINSSFQWHSWFFKVEARFNHSFPNHAYASHIASRISYHVLHHVAWALHVVDCVPFACCSCLGRDGRRVRERGALEYTYKDQSNSENFCRQDDHTLKITTIFAC